MFFTFLLVLLTAIATDAITSTSFSPISWIVASTAIWLAVLFKQGLLALNQDPRQRIAFAQLGRLALLALISNFAFYRFIKVTDPSFSGWEDVYFFCGRPPGLHTIPKEYVDSSSPSAALSQHHYYNNDQMHYCNANFHWNAAGFYKAGILWLFVMSSAVGLRELLLLLFLGPLLPGEGIPLLETCLCVVWRLLPYWLNNWERKWGAECASMLFEVQHFATELALVIPCVQVLSVRLRMLIFVERPGGGRDEGVDNNNNNNNNINMNVGNEDVPRRQQQPHHQPQRPRQAGGRDRRANWHPDFIEFKMVDDPSQHHFLPRLRSNSRMIILISTVTVIALLNALVVPVGLEKRISSSARGDIIVSMEKELSFLHRAGKSIVIVESYDGYKSNSNSGDGDSGTSNTDTSSSSSVLTEYAWPHDDGDGGGGGGGERTGGEGRAASASLSTPPPPPTPTPSSSSSSGIVSKSTKNNTSDYHQPTPTPSDDFNAVLLDLLHAARSSKHGRLAYLTSSVLYTRHNSDDAKIALWSGLWKPLLPAPWLKAALTTPYYYSGAKLDLAVLSALQYEERGSQESELLAEAVVHGAGSLTSPSFSTVVLGPVVDEEWMLSRVKKAAVKETKALLAQQEQFKTMAMMHDNNDSNSNDERGALSLPPPPPLAVREVESLLLGLLAIKAGVNTSKPLQLRATAALKDYAADLLSDSRSALPSPVTAVTWLRQRQYSYVSIVDREAFVGTNGGIFGTSTTTRRSDYVGDPYAVGGWWGSDIASPSPNHHHYHHNINAFLQLHYHQTQQHQRTAPLVKALIRHSIELKGMRDPSRRSNLPFIEVALSIMRLSHEGYWGLLGAYVLYILRRDPEEWSRKLVLCIAKVAYLFHGAILLVFPAVCWAYGAGPAFSGLVSLMFWSRPLLKLKSRLRNTVATVEPAKWRVASKEECESTDTCAICWGDLKEVDDGGDEDTTTTTAAPPSPPTSTPISLIPCGHVYHKECVSNWTQQCWVHRRQATCPMCQSHIELKVTFKRPRFASSSTGTGTDNGNEGEDGNGDNNMRRGQHHLQMADLVREVLQDVLPRQLGMENQDVAHIMAFAPDNDNNNDDVGWNDGGGEGGGDREEEGGNGNPDDNVGGGDGEGGDQRNNDD
jgi:hypothetical protein